jgi:hypothetical protein
MFNKLHDIYTFHNMSPSLSHVNRIDLAVRLRSRIGHTRVTHSHLLTRDDAPFCTGCKEIFYCQS